MIVWGGDVSTWSQNTGGRYSPTGDAWTATSTGANVPPPRAAQTVVWTGTQMIVWGGYEPYRSSGGIYCGCSVFVSAYRDADEDGYGDPAGTTTTCIGSLPSGYVAAGTDCNDASASIHPGAVELCNGIDDDCDGSNDDGVSAPPASTGLTAARFGSSVVLAWTTVEDADGYDIVKGSLPGLAASGGDFTASTTGCLANNVAAASAQDSSGAPPPGSGSWYLVRAFNACGGNGTYDESGQTGSRDAEIQAAAAPCP